VRGRPQDAWRYPPLAEFQHVPARSFGERAKGARSGTGSGPDVGTRAFIRQLSRERRYCSCAPAARDRHCLTPVDGRWWGQARRSACAPGSRPSCVHFWARWRWPVCCRAQYDRGLFMRPGATVEGSLLLAELRRPRDHLVRYGSACMVLTGRTTRWRRGVFCDRGLAELMAQSGSWFGRPPRWVLRDLSPGGCRRDLGASFHSEWKMG